MDDHPSWPADDDEDNIDINALIEENLELEREAQHREALSRELSKPDQSAGKRSRFLHESNNDDLDEMLEMQRELELEAVREEHSSSTIPRIFDDSAYSNSGKITPRKRLDFSAVSTNTLNGALEDQQSERRLFSSESDEDEHPKVQDSSIPTKSKNIPSAEQVAEERMKREQEKILLRMPEFSDFVVLQYDQQTVYLRRRAPAIKSCLPRHRSHDATPLLPVPIHMLLAQIEEESLNKQQLQAEKTAHDIMRNPLINFGPSSSNVSTLWVDKYRPRKYMDLLSDERVNRAVLAWLKSWDRCVFGRAPPQTKRTSKKTQNQVEDPLHRPEKKILLLCGPPGLGKTTLAHVLAYQAGYNAVEINASDDRSAEVLRNKITSATEMQSVFGERRPNCIILDEVDGIHSGAGQSPLEIIFKMIHADPKPVKGEKDKKKKKSSNSDANEEDEEEEEEGNEENATENDVNKKKKGRQSKSSSISALIRPIICICNDQYAPALRTLRREAIVLNMPRIALPRVIGRIKDICSREGLTADMKAMVALCELTEGDLRSTINTLQFLKSKTNNVTTEAVQQAAIGVRDQKKSLFAVLDEIFKQQVTKTSKQKWPSGAVTGGMSSYSQTPFFHRLLGVIDASEEDEKLVEACFQNYLGVRYNDPNFLNTISSLDWLQFYDRIDSYTRQSQDYSIFGYKKMTLLGIHANCASVGRPVMEYPFQSHKVMTMISTAQNILDTFVFGRNEVRVNAGGTSEHIGGLSPDHLRISKPTLITEWLPELARILSPPFKPTSEQLMSAQERVVLSRLVSIMIDQGLTYQQSKSLDGVYRYTLDPPVGQLVLFQRAGAVSFMEFSYHTTQLIANEIERERLRRALPAPMPVQVPTYVAPVPIVPKRPAPVVTVAPAVEPDKVVDIDAEIARKKAKVLAEKPPTDFFGRPIINDGAADAPHLSRADELLKSQRQVKSQRRVWYKFNEGFSNAVRKPVALRDLLK